MPHTNSEQYAGCSDMVYNVPCYKANIIALLTTFITVRLYYSKILCPPSNGIS